MKKDDNAPPRKSSWLSDALGLFARKRKHVATPPEVSPLPENRAFDREENIEYLKHNYPEREYQPPNTSPQPDEDQKKIEKDKPLRGFHGG